MAKESEPELITDDVPEERVPANLGDSAKDLLKADGLSRYLAEIAPTRT